MISAWECLHFATLELVRSTPIKQRLISAYRRYFAALPAEEVPSEVRESYAHVMSCLCGVQPLRGEDAVAASVRKMSNQEADECAAQIVEIFGLMCKSHHGAGRTATVVQLHPVERTAEDFAAPALIASN
ncbi:MAG TPA: hypothetical protein VHW95_05525 [Steroidobacteraceae bacterium]|jgi:hypothetical protein|nr:hypothetical protein [Steroidobacteraceae bacterium]